MVASSSIRILEEVFSSLRRWKTSSMPSGEMHLRRYDQGGLNASDAMRGALIPLAVLGLVYRYGVGLMIRGARRRRWAIMPDVSSRKLTMSTFEMLLVT